MQKRGKPFIQNSVKHHEPGSRINSRDVHISLYWQRLQRQRGSHRGSGMLCVLALTLHSNKSRLRHIKGAPTLLPIIPECYPALRRHSTTAMKRAPETVLRYAEETIACLYIPILLREWSFIPGSMAIGHCRVVLCEFQRCILFA